MRRIGAGAWTSHTDTRTDDSQRCLMRRFGIAVQKNPALQTGTCKRASWMYDAKIYLLSQHRSEFILRIYFVITLPFKLKLHLFDQSPDALTRATKQASFQK